MKPTQTILFTMILLTTGAFSASCSQKGQAAQPAKQEKEISTNIKTVVIQPQSLSEIVSVMGTVLPNRDVTLSAETAGRVERLQVDLGDRVKKGQVLARIDYDMLKAQYEQAQANHELAKKSLVRIQQLRKDELASQQQLDEVITREHSASASMRIAHAQLQKSMLRSSLNGIVARKMVEEGEYVNPGQPMLQVVEFHTVVISAQVPENIVSKIKRGMSVEVDIPSLSLKTQGKVYVVVPAAHPGSRTFELRIKTPNPDYDILVGMSTNLEIKVDTHKQSIVIPIDTVLESGGTKSVFVEKNGKAKRLPVKVGPTEGSRILVTQGLTIGDKLVIEGHRDLIDGQPVEVVNAPSKVGSNANATSPNTSSM